MRHILKDFRGYLSERGYNELDICSGSREPHFTNQRRNVAKYMVDRGYSIADIAHVMDKSSSSIRYLTGVENKRKKRPRKLIERECKLIAAERDFKSICMEKGYCPTSLQSKIRKKDLVQKRTEVAKEMRAKDHKYKAIGHAMNRDHTTVAYMADENIRERKVVRMNEYRG